MPSSYARDIADLWRAVHQTGPGAGQAPLSATVVGTSGPDTLTGTLEADTINGANGDDTCFGMGGDDLIQGGNGHDVLRGGFGNDEVYGMTRANLGGSTVADLIYGDAGDDT